MRLILPCGSRPISMGLEAEDTTMNLKRLRTLVAALENMPETTRLVLRGRDHSYRYVRSIHLDKAAEHGGDFYEPGAGEETVSILVVE